MLRRSLTHDPRFVNCPGERLLAIDVLAALHRGYGRNRVRMIRRSDTDSVDLFVHLIEHPPEVLERFGLGMFLENVSRTGLVHVAKCHNLSPAARDVIEITAAL